MNELVLTGCMPEPMMSYLKGLGILRLVADQKDASVRACWKGGTFYLHSILGQDELVAFFLKEYIPTSVLAPWNGGSGFYPKDPQDAIRAIEGSTSPRLARYRSTIGIVRDLLERLDLKAKPIDKNKQAVLRACRAELPDEVVPWLDATYVLMADKPKYPPILGTGANDGRLEFTNNFMQRLVEVIPLQLGDTGEPGARAVAKGRRKPGRRLPDIPFDAERSEAWLQAALFGIGSPTLIKAAVGQFHPGGVGGPNATQGFEADSLINPWDYVLMMEGTLLFAGAVARRLSSETREKATFPFTVTPSPVGYGSGTEVESTPDGSRAELWLPLWERPVTKFELEYLLAEGRAQVGRRQARNGVDFARAVASLGVDRGITAFQRFGFLKRSGKNYLAAPIGRIEVVGRLEVSLLDALDPWLDRLRQACQEKETPPRYQRALRGIDRAIFEFCTRGGPRRLQEILIALGDAERAIVTGKRIREQVPPLYHLSPRWLKDCDDGSTEFRLAAAFASIRGDADGKIGPFRAHLEPVTWKKRRFDWTDLDHSVAWGGGDLVRNLSAVLERRCLEARMQSHDSLPLSGRINASLADVHRFLIGQVEEGRMVDLIWGLATLKWSEFRDEDRPRWLNERAPTLYRAYALLKLLFLPAPLRRRGGPDEVMVKPEPAILALLRAGKIRDACEVAARRLGASGFVPLARDFHLPGRDAQRLAAALLIPVWETEHLAGLVLRPGEEAS